MDLEDKVLEVIDVGVVKYKELLDMQSKNNEELKNDVLYIAQCEKHIDFGNNKKKNKFSLEAEEKLTEKYGILMDEKGYVKEEILRDLEGNGFEDYGFSVSKRGGGSTVIGPGQTLFFFSADVKGWTGSDDAVKSLKPVVSMFNDVMLNSLKEYVGEELFLQNQGYSEMLKDDNFDVAYLKEGKPYKLGSKGLMLHNTLEGLRIKGGFSIHGTRRGIEGFNLVHACGISPEEIGIGCIEDLTLFDRDKFIGYVLDEVKENMNYTKINYKN